MCVCTSCCGAAEPAAEPAAEVAEEAVPWLGVYLGMPVKALRAARPHARVVPLAAEEGDPRGEHKRAGQRAERFLELLQGHRLFASVDYRVKDGKLVMLLASVRLPHERDELAMTTRMMHRRSPEEIARGYKKGRKAFYEWLSEFRGGPTDRAIVKVRREFEYMAPLLIWKGKNVTVAATVMPGFSEIVPFHYEARMIIFLHEETQLPKRFAPITLDAESERDVYRRAAIPPALEKGAKARE